MPAAYYTLESAAAQPLKRVGGKASALGRLIGFGAPVPPGFVVPPDTNLESAAAELTAAATTLSSDFVAVRSSAAGEDAPDKSWAGQFQSYLYVTPADVPRRIADCRASSHSAHAQAYDASHRDMPVAAVVQAMVAADTAGVLFTANPITHARDEIMIEAVYGLGEQLVQGLATPDNFVVNKSTGHTTSHRIATKTTKLTGSDRGVTEHAVPRDQQDQPTLNNAQLSDLARLASDLEAKFHHALDIEFAYHDGKLFILQARPITTLA